MATIDFVREHHQSAVGVCYAPEDATLPNPWKGLIDERSGQLYYWNTESNQTQFEKPDGSSTHSGRRIRSCVVVNGDGNRNPKFLSARITKVRRTSKRRLMVQNARKKSRVGSFKSWKVLLEAPPRFLFVQAAQRRLFNCLRLKHTNIVLCIDGHTDMKYNVNRFVFESFDYSLAEFLQKMVVVDRKTYFWKFTKRGAMIGMAPPLQEIVNALLEAVTYISAKNISHNKIQSLDNIVFSREGVPMLHNFSWSTFGDGQHATQDLRGIADMVETIMSSCSIGRSELAIEVRSLLNLLRNFPDTMDLAVIKGHPALMTAADRRKFVYTSIGDDLSLRGDRWVKFNRRFKMTATGVPRPSLEYWIERAKTKACLRTRAESKDYSDCPASLANFTRNTYRHIDDRNKVIKYPDKRLEKIFLKLFPNLFVEWWGHKEDMDRTLYRYNVF